MLVTSALLESIQGMKKIYYMCEYDLNTVSSSSLVMQLSYDKQITNFNHRLCIYHITIVKCHSSHVQYKYGIQKCSSASKGKW